MADYQVAVNWALPNAVRSEPPWGNFGVSIGFCSYVYID